MSATKLPQSINLILSSLPRKEENFIRKSCETVHLTFSQILNTPGKEIPYVYFPISAVICLLKPINSNSNVEVAMIGNEGMLGLNLALGINFSTLGAIVQGKGTALRLDSKQFLQIYDKSPFLQAIFKRYIFVRMCQLSQTIGCNRFHVVDKRLARWILMSQDCAHSNEFPITHEFLSYILGVRRAGITKSAGMLQKRKLISYRRGQLKILNRKGLESASCECYKKNKHIITFLDRQFGIEILIPKTSDTVKYYVAYKFEWNKQ